MRSLALAPALVLTLALPLTLACRPTTSAGDEDATTYRVTGVVSESACSPGLDPIDPLVYDVEVRSSGPTVYWRLGRSAWTPGSIASDGSFRISTRSAIEVIADYPGTDPDLDPPRRGCTLLQTETIAARFVEPDDVDGGSSDAGDAGAASSDADALDGGVTSAADASPDADASASDAGPPDPTAIGALEGENTIEISIAPGSDCAPLLLVNGGSFPALPCVVRYTIAGVARD